MELGNYQSYLLRPIHEKDLIELVIVSKPTISETEKIAAIWNTKELIIDVKMFIDDLMQEIMTSAVKEFPITCYLPCPECDELHVPMEKVVQTSSVYCPATGHFTEMIKYHKMLTSSK